MVKSITTRSKMGATNSIAPPSPHDTAVETSNSHAATVAQLGPILEQMLPHPPLLLQPLNIAPIRASKEAQVVINLALHNSLLLAQTAKRLNRKADELTRRVKDQSNLVDQLPKHINFVRDFGPRFDGEERRMGESTGRHLERSQGYQVRTSRQEGGQERADQHAGISQALVSGDQSRMSTHSRLSPRTNGHTRLRAQSDVYTRLALHGSICSILSPLGDQMRNPPHKEHERRHSPTQTGRADSRPYVVENLSQA